MAGKPQKHRHRQRRHWRASAIVLAILIVWIMNLVAGIQGTARIINYARTVRGKTQRIVKLKSPVSSAGRHDRRY